MKKILILAAILFSTATYSQELRYGIGYTNLYSQQFDRLIQTYNFSRPFLTEKQPLISHGVGVDFAYLFNSEKNLKRGLGIDYSRFGSKSSNLNIDLSFTFHSTDLSYILLYQNEEKFGNFYGEAGLSAVLGLLNKKVNSEQVIVDDEVVRSYHLGGEINLGIGHVFELNNGFKLSPFAGLSYSPYLGEGDSELVINQTSGLVDEQFVSYFKFQLGCRFHFSKSEN